jgi:putative membrane protein
MTGLRTVAIGASVLAVAWLAPLAALTGGGFAAHMLGHMLVVVVAAPLVAFGLSGTRIDPLPRLPWLGAAIPASLIDLAVVSAWHAPALHHAARHRLDAFAVEQASFLAASLWLWLAVFGGGATARQARAGGSVVALLLTFAHMTLLGALLSLTPRPLYAHADPAARLSPLADQQLGGTIMLVFGGGYIAAGLWLGLGLVRETKPLEARR